MIGVIKNRSSAPENDRDPLSPSNGKGIGEETSGYGHWMKDVETGGSQFWVIIRTIGNPYPGSKFLRK
jgi:hypothetical protein